MGNVKTEESTKEYVVSEELEEQILKLLLLGISTRKIRNVLKVDYPTFKQTKDSLKLKNKISDDEIKKAVQEREEKDKNTIYKFLTLGYSYVELINTVPYGDRHYIEKLVGKLKDEGRITDEEIEKYRFERNERQKREIILQGLDEGLQYKEIAENYNEICTDKKISENVVCDYVKKLVNEGIRTKEEIQERRKIRENEIKAKSIGPHEEKLIELFGFGFNREEIKKVMQLTSQELWRLNKKLKDKGKITEEEIQNAIENRQDESKERQTQIAKMINFTREIDENVIQTHLDYVKATYQLEELENKDIKLLRKVIPMDSKLVSFDNANFILRVLTKQNKDVQAIEFIDECMLACEDDKKKCGKLQEAKTQIETKIIQMKERGRRNTLGNKVITIPRFRE